MIMKKYEKPEIMPTVLSQDCVLLASGGFVDGNDDGDNFGDNDQFA